MSAFFQVTANADSADAASLESESGPIHVHLQQKKKGAEYLVESEFQLGKIIPR
jgi:hypothetical protein